MPFVTVEMFEGRTTEQKRALMKNVTEAIVNAIQCPPEAITIKIVDMKRENVGRAGVPYGESK